MSAEAEVIVLASVAGVAGCAAIFHDVFGLPETLRALRWHFEARFAWGRPLDRLVVANAYGVRREVVFPRWWDARRWWQWLCADETHELVLLDARGNPKFLRFRTRFAPEPRPRPIQLPGKTIVPREPPRALLFREEDKQLRHVPDDVLEREGKTVKE